MIRELSAALFFGVSIPQSGLAQGKGPAAGEHSAPSICAQTHKPVMHQLVAQIRDTTQYRPETDTLWSAAKAVVRKCARRYSDRRLSLAEQINTVRVHLNSGDDIAALSAANDALHQAGNDVSVRAWTYYLLIHDMLTAQPSRTAMALPFLRQLDELPRPAAAKGQFLAHYRWMKAVYPSGNDSIVDAEGSAAIGIWRTIADTALKMILGPEARSTFEYRIDIAMRTRGINAAQAMIDSSVALRLGGFDIYDKIGQSAPRIDVPFEFSKSDSHDKGMGHPQQGRVTLVFGIKTDYGRVVSRYFGKTMERQLKTFGQRGLTLVNLTRTFGYFSDTAPVAPKREAEHVFNEVSTLLDVPGTVAAYETAYTWVPDGRRRNEPSPVFDWYVRNGRIVVVDKRGIVRYIAPIDLPEPLLAKFIDRLLSE